MVNYWYNDTCIAEAQLVLQSFKGMTKAQAQKVKNKVKFNHFNYELERNPLGSIIHCVEILIKQEAEDAELEGTEQNSSA